MKAKEIPFEVNCKDVVTSHCVKIRNMITGAEFSAPAKEWQMNVISYNQSTSMVEKWINSAFFKKDKPLQKVSTKNVKIIVKAIMERYQRKYIMEDIDLSGLGENGLSVFQQLEPLDDWDGSEEGFSGAKKWLYRHLKDSIEVLGIPSSILESEGHYYALWRRNIVTWF